MTMHDTQLRRAPEGAGGVGWPGAAAPTPRDTKRLSDIDEVLRGHVPFVFLRGVRAADPATVIRRALEEALVPYYPLAGRVREVEERKKLVSRTSVEEPGDETALDGSHRLPLEPLPPRRWCQQGEQGQDDYCEIVDIMSTEEVWCRVHPPTAQNFIKFDYESAGVNKDEMYKLFTE
ncbi:hypothetical protein EJB05_33969, partial [Eragrostis curvula]